MRNQKITDLFDFIALDIETTGLNFQENEIIEIGAVKYKNCNKIDELNIFIKPQGLVPKFIKQLTHITDEQLDSGLSFSKALKKLKEFIDDDLLICHNTDFDIGFINTQLKLGNESLISNKILDTLELSRIYLPFLKNHKLGSVAAFFAKTNKSAHRAIYDAAVTADIFIEMLSFIDNYIPLTINNKLQETLKSARIDTDLEIFLERVSNYQRRQALLKPKKKDITKYFDNKNFIESDPKKNEDTSIEKIFKPEGYFDENFDNYEYREGQVQMSKAVYSSFDKDQFLLVEAGTGVGKSLAYLIPAIKFSNENDEKVVISTNTKNLQEQLFNKDLPIIKKCTKLEFLAVILKGRDNYICEKKWLDLTFEIDKKISPYEAKELLNLIVWKEFTKTGVITENTSFKRRRSSLWSKLAADRHFCSGKKCPNYGNCFLMQTRQKASKANLVIVNHSLLLADIVGDMNTIGKYRNLVIDEAHNLPSISSRNLGFDLSFPDINSFLNLMYIRNKKFEGGMLTFLKSATVKSRIKKDEKKYLKQNINEVIEILKDKKDSFADFFRKIGKLVREEGSYNKLRVKNNQDFDIISEDLITILEVWDKLISRVSRISDQLHEINSNVFPDYDKHLDNIDGLLQRLEETKQKFLFLNSANFERGAYWFSKFRSYDKDYPNGIFNFAPLDIDKLLNSSLYNKIDSLILTSATLSIRGKFKYFFNRLGFNLVENKKVNTLIVPSPFDYKKQTKVFISSFLPAPRDKKFFPFQSSRIIADVIGRSKSGSMVLFTSYKDLNFVFDQINDDFYKNNIPVLAQGKGMSRTLLLKEFIEHGSAVLLGTNSFWEGVDIPGKPLSLLILYKIPFLVPSEPIVEAYIEKLESEGKNSFIHYMLPNALLRYKQGFGRLIRNKQDRGVVLVLDNRIAKKRYGKYFMQILPRKSQVVSSEEELLNEIENWFIKI